MKSPTPQRSPAAPTDARPGAAAPDERLLPVLPGFLFRAEKPVLTVVMAWAMAFFGSLILASLAGLVAPDAARPDVGDPGAFTFYLLVWFAPFVETLIMGAGLTVLMTFLTPGRAIVASAILWGAAHSLLGNALVWGVVIWWPFLIFSTLFVVWRRRSLLWAIAVPTMVHMLQNLIPGLAASFPDLLPF